MDLGVDCLTSFRPDTIAISPATSRTPTFIIADHRQLQFLNELNSLRRVDIRRVLMAHACKHQMLTAGFHLQGLAKVSHTFYSRFGAL